MKFSFPHLRSFSDEINSQRKGLNPIDKKRHHGSTTRSPSVVKVSRVQAVTMWDKYERRSLVKRWGLWRAKWRRIIVPRRMRSHKRCCCGGRTVRSEEKEGTRWYRKGAKGFRDVASCRERGERDGERWFVVEVSLGCCPGPLTLLGPLGCCPPLRLRIAIPLRSTDVCMYICYDIHRHRGYLVDFCVSFL